MASGMTASPALAGGAPALSPQGYILFDLMPSRPFMPVAEAGSRQPRRRWQPSRYGRCDVAPERGGAASVLRGDGAGGLAAGRMSRLRAMAARGGGDAVGDRRRQHASRRHLRAGSALSAAGTIARSSNDRAVSAPGELGVIVAQRWGQEIRRGPIPLHSHGSAALRQYGAGGARAEAAGGFPSVYDIGLPALRLGRALAPGDPGAAPVQACFALIAAVRDTNLLHRGGSEGARYAAEAAAAFLSAGGVGASDWRTRAALVNAGFVARRLSPGGCADLLAMTLFVDALESRTEPR